MRRPIWAILGLCCLSIACSKPVSQATAVSDPTQLAGIWRAVLTSPGGPLPFSLEISDDNGTVTAVALTAGEPEPFGSVSLDGDQVLLDMPWYDSAIRATLSADGQQLDGEWKKTVPAGFSRLSFAASRGSNQRFSSLEPGDGSPHAELTDSVDGDWQVLFTDDSGTEPARGEFRQDGTRVTGTFLTPTGDYRFLEGSFEHGRLRLSTFDGGHAFLFDAEIQVDGTIAGDFWSRDSYHATWTGQRIETDTTVLPDAWSLVGLTNTEGRFRFSFPDLEGAQVSLEDDRFDGKVVLVNIFGSWCPNCNDKAPLLADWYRRYRQQGFEIVGLAYEFTGDIERDRRQVHRYAERHGVEFPLLLAGLSDKKKAAETLPDLSAVVAFPTSVFVGRDGKVRRIHTGFAGPGTGDHYGELVRELEELIENLLAEPA